MLEVRQLALRRTQLMVNYTDTLLYELSGFLSYLILLIVCVLIIERNQTIHEIHASLLYCIVHADLRYRRGLGRGGHAQVFHIILGGLRRRIYGNT